MFYKLLILVFNFANSRYISRENAKVDIFFDKVQTLRLLEQSYQVEIAHFLLLREFVPYRK